MLPPLVAIAWPAYSWRRRKRNSAAKVYVNDYGTSKDLFRVVGDRFVERAELCRGYRCRADVTAGRSTP